jgi:hypothetical protein
MAFIGVKYRVYPLFSHTRGFYSGMIDLTKQGFLLPCKEEDRRLVWFHISYDVKLSTYSPSNITLK